MLKIEDVQKITKLKRDNFKQDKITNFYLKRINLRIKKAAEKGYGHIRVYTLFINPVRLNAITNLYEKQGYYVANYGSEIVIHW